VIPQQNDPRLQAVAAHLFTWSFPAARRRMQRRNFQPRDLLGLERSVLVSLGFSSAALKDFPEKYLIAAQCEIERCRQTGIRVIPRDDPYYPPLLQEIFDPPGILYIKGDPTFLQGMLLGVVGSRRADEYGRRAVNRLIPPVCRAGITVVSGMAYGIDSLAHRAALDSGMPTVGVNACGMDQLYPAGNRRLLHRIQEQGCIVSEAPLGTQPLPFLFPVRNRIISGLCRAVVVVQGTVRSGSLITARLALDQDRELMSVPGPLDSPLSSGPHHLIQQGAKLVQQPDDILEEFGLKSASVECALESLSSRQRRVLDLMSTDAVKRIDDFVETLNLPVPVVVSLLLELTIKGLIREEGDGYRKLA
jgi:DNA processing protein